MNLQRSDDLLACSVGLQSTPAGIIRAAVDVSRTILMADSTFAAISDGSGHYPITIMSGIKDPKFSAIHVRAGAGLGGQVLVRGRPLSIADYAHDPTISRDFVHLVAEVEGISGMACVPLVGPAGLEALLYVASRVAESPGDVAIGTLDRVATYARLGLQHLAARERELELERLRERQRLAGELHDSVAQMLFSIGVAAHYSRGQRDPETLLAAMEDIELTAATARRELRETLARLSQTEDRIGFEARVEGEVRLFQRTSGCAVTITRHGDPRALPEPVETLILDTLIEGLRNAVKHVAARLAIAHFGYGAGQVMLTLQAQPGAPSTQAARGGWPASGSGSGIELLKQRARDLRGSLELETQPDGIKVLKLELPTIRGASTG
ncbi:histidine kinase [Conexibacter sp. S30A1]|jgi:signal transduction histidine kinase|uniref:GAF domain-containing sensor histidine kinase n=1 Tax=Conexibacter sp. S30A1 TaxID=2937800 RepID=UPI00200EE5AA|nr:histidine kinase [Conexibacter sp. S30A1]